MDLLGELRKLFSFSRKPMPTDDEDVDSELAPALAKRLNDLSNPRDAVQIAGSSSAPPAAEPVASGVRRSDHQQPDHSELNSSIDRLRQQIEQQAARIDELLELVERVPENIRGLSEIARQSAKLLEGIEERFKHDDSRKDTVDSALEGVRETVSQQAAVLGLLQEQLDRNDSSNAQVVNALTGLRPTLTDMAEGDKHAGELLAELVHGAKERETRLNASIARMQRWMIGAMAVSGAVAIAAIAIALIAMSRGS